MAASDKRRQGFWEDFKFPSCHFAYVQQQKGPIGAEGILVREEQCVVVYSDCYWYLILCPTSLLPLANNHGFQVIALPRFRFDFFDDG